MYWTSVICNSHIPWTVEHIETFMITANDKMIDNYELVVKDKEEKTEESSSTIDRHFTVKKDSLFTVKKCQDSLFWSLYVGKHGIKEYERVSRMNNVEIKEKEEIANYFFKLGAANISTKMPTKISKVSCGKIVEDILTQPKTNLFTLCAFNVFYNCNIYIVDIDKKTFIQHTVDNQDQYDNIILYRNTQQKNTTYNVDIAEQLYTLEHLKNNFLALVSHEKPLKAISNYKVCDLEPIALKIGMSSTGMKKSELYEKVVVHCAW